MTRAARAIWTFLTRERGRRRAPAVRRRRRQRGIALITVLIAISLTMITTQQFATTTTIDMIAANNYRDQMRAHFLARSAINLSEFVIRLQQRIDDTSKKRGFEMLKGVQITEFANQLLLAFCGSPEEVRAAVGNAASLAKGLGTDIGTCGVVGSITTEDDKLNVNCANSAAASAKTTKSALDALLFFNAYDPVFEEADAEGWRRDRAMQVAAIIDYIDSNSIRGVDERGTTEDYGYENLKDHYKPKNNYIDTVGELKLVRGIDDRFWTLFGQAFTVYGSCKMNLSAITNVQLIAGILYLGAKNPSDPMLQDPRKLFALAGVVAKAKQFGFQFSSADDFVDFVKDPAAQLTALLGRGEGSAGPPGPGMNELMQLMGGQKLGMELDKTKLGQISTTGPRRTYRVEAWGEVDRAGTMFPPIRSTITGVWDQRVQLQNQRNTSSSFSEGAWVFLRED